jgi:hypothetical protein
MREINLVRTLPVCIAASILVSYLLNEIFPAISHFQVLVGELVGMGFTGFFCQRSPGKIALV